MSRYLRYVIRNISPVRIADDDVSQSGQTETLRYIPGSTIRGLVVNGLSKKYGDGFESIKGELLSESFCFLNAYLTTEGHSLIPSPKGFYEDKMPVEKGEKKNISNVVTDGSFTDGMKRASLGRYCYIENGCIYYGSLETGSDLKIRINTGERGIFRNEYIDAGYLFEGFIRLPESDISSAIISMFQKGTEIYLGNARSYGLGKCFIEKSELFNGSLPYEAEMFDAPGECYMMLLSDTVMRSDTGEYCGINEEKLAELLNVTDLKIPYASTSVRTVRGYNRTLGIHTPSVNVYEAGSVFHLTYQKTVTKEAMKAVTDSGLGIRKAEGFGRVMFIKDYEKITSKSPCDFPKYEIPAADAAKLSLNDYEEKTLESAARSYLFNVIDNAVTKYVLSHSLQRKNVKNSKMGQIASILAVYRNDRNVLCSFFKHEHDKEEGQKIQKEGKNVAPIEEQINDILDTPLITTLFGSSYPFRKNGMVMGIPVEKLITKEEEDYLKVELLLSMFRYENKNGTEV